MYALISDVIFDKLNFLKRSIYLLTALRTKFDRHTYF